MSQYEYLLRELFHKYFFCSSIACLDDVHATLKIFDFVSFRIVNMHDFAFYSIVFYAVGALFDNIEIFPLISRLIGCKTSLWNN